jgi:hypothetical protein
LIRTPAVLGVLPPGYHDLFGRAMSVLAGKDPVRAVWLSGSLASDRADPASDLDFRLAVRDSELAAFGADWPAWLAEITPTVVARALPGAAGSFYCLTPACERMDVYCEAVSALKESPFLERLLVLDKDGLDAEWPRERPARQPNRAAISYLIEETLRQAANYSTVTVRNDCLLGVVAIQQIHLMLYQLFSEANVDVPVMGPKQWSRKLTPQQRTLLESLPVPQPRLDEVKAAHVAALAAFVTHGRAVAEASGVEWPVRLHSAISEYLAREHGEQIPGPG